MKTEVIFTDERFELVQIRWYGGSTFNVWVNKRGADYFTRYGDDEAGPPSYEQAKTAAQAYFNKLSFNAGDKI